MRLYKFRNINASSIRTIMIARCVNDAEDDQASSEPREAALTIDGKRTSHHECRQGKARLRPNVQQYLSQKLQLYTDGENNVRLLQVDHNSADFRENIEYNMEYRRAESTLAMNQCGRDDCSTDQDMLPSSSGQVNQRMPGSQSDGALHVHQNPVPCSHSKSATACKSQPGDRYLIFTAGMKTYTPHQIGIKRIRASEATEKMKARTSADGTSPPASTPLDPDPGGLGGQGQEEFDTVDHLIELHGHIIGMCLSPDHR